MNETQKELTDLVIANAYFREKITLSSGKESDYYIDARRVTLMARGAHLCAKLICDEVKDDAFDAIGGPTLGADPMIGAVGVVSDVLGTPYNTFIIRKAPKKHGKQQQIEGPDLPEGGSVVLIDDVATTGKAFIESIAVLKELNIKVLKAICVCDRQEGAKEAVEALGVPLVSLLDINDIHKK